MSSIEKKVEGHVDDKVQIYKVENETSFTRFVIHPFVPISWLHY